MYTVCTFGCIFLWNLVCTFGLYLLKLGHTVWLYFFVKLGVYIWLYLLMKHGVYFWAIFIETWSHSLAVFLDETLEFAFGCIYWNLVCTFGCIYWWNLVCTFDCIYWWNLICTFWLYLLMKFGSVLLNVFICWFWWNLAYAFIVTRPKYCQVDCWTNYAHIMFDVLPCD